MRLIAIFLITLFSFNCYSNESEKDSLLHELSEPHSTGEKLQTIIQLFKFATNIQELDQIAALAAPVLAQSDDSYEINNYKKTEGGYRLSNFDYSKGMQLLHESLVEFEKLNDSIQISFINQRLAVHHFYLEDWEPALNYIQASIRTNPKNKLDANYANKLMTLGIIYCSLKDFEKGIKWQLEAIEIRKKNQEFNQLPISLNNLSETYLELGDTVKAVEFLNQSIALSDSLGTEEATVYAKFLKGELYLKSGDYAASVPLIVESIEWWEAENSLKDLPRAYESLLASYKGLDRKDDIIYVLEKLIELDKQEYNEKSVSAANEIEAKYNVEKRELELTKEKQEREWAVEESRLTRESERKNFYIFIIISTFLAFSIIYFYVRFKNQRRDKNTILDQKLVIETRSQEIKDSILYAKRLQSAIMPTVESIEEIFNAAFVLYTPKDIVAGDFYWMDQIEGTILIAAADCTGHGVPGAMVSVVCTNGLNSAVRQHGLKSPAAILDKTREIVVGQFAKSGENVKDGMDIALCAVENGMLKFAGANNPVWIIRKLAHATTEQLENKGNLIGEEHILIETKGDKQPIGLSDHQRQFKETAIKLCVGDLIYLLTDGYADQFGGFSDGILNSGGKKFKYSRLKQLLLDNCTETFPNQRIILATAFDKWKGDLEQVDDVCFIGFKVD